MRIHYLFLFCCYWLCACQSDKAQQAGVASKLDTVSGESTEQTNGTLASTAGESIMLRQAYHDYYAKLEPKFPVHCVSEANKANPADEAVTDTAFFVFRERLREIVVQKDIFKLLEQINPNIKVDFGGGHGLQDFIKTWELDSPEKVPQSRLWPTLEEILALGGTFSTFDNYKDGKNLGQIKYFQAPYLDACMPADGDPYIDAAVIGAGVRLRNGPGLNSKVVAKLSYDVIEFIEETPIEETIGGETHSWIKVKLKDGTEGFLYGKFFRSPIDFRAIFEQNEAGAWKMITLIAGD